MLGVIIEIRPGEGGADAEAFAFELSNMIASWCLTEGRTVTIDESNPRLRLVTVDDPPT